MDIEYLVQHFQSHFLKVTPCYVRYSPLSPTVFLQHHFLTDLNSRTLRAFIASDGKYFNTSQVQYYFHLSTISGLHSQRTGTPSLHDLSAPNQVTIFSRIQLHQPLDKMPILGLLYRWEDNAVRIGVLAQDLLLSNLPIAKGSRPQMRHL